MLDRLISDLQKISNPEKAKNLQRFFKTGKGGYGEGDVFLGITVPEQRKIAKKYPDMTLKELQKLLSSRIHEHRLTSLFILIQKYNKADEAGRKIIYDFYFKNMKHINNWDLVDLSAEKIAGAYLFDKERSVLYQLAGSKNLWERRIAIMSTFYFIRNRQFNDTLKMAGTLLNDGHDLIHKAVGWMLREIGKRDQDVEEDFLKKHYGKMPRTMLRYAIERFDEKKRRFYMKR